MRHIYRITDVRDALFRQRGNRRLGGRLFFLRHRRSRRYGRGGRAETRRESAGTKRLDMLLFRGEVLAGRSRILPGRTRAGSLRGLVSRTGIEPRRV